MILILLKKPTILPNIYYNFAYYSFQIFRHSDNERQSHIEIIAV